MIDADTLSVARAPPDRRIALTAAVSVALHLALLGPLVLPRLQGPEPVDPPAVNVDLVPPSQLPSQPEPSSAPPSSVEPSSAPPAASAEASAAPRSPAASEDAAAAMPPSSGRQASTGALPEPAKPVVIPVGPSEASSEEASSAQDGSASAEPPSAPSDPAASAPAELTAVVSGIDSATAPPGTTPRIKGALHVARRFYLETMLDAPAMAQARDAMRKLPPEKRLVQTCNIEAVGQLGNAGRGFSPDALIADALAKPVGGGSSFTVTGGAFRSGGRWRAIAYSCVLSPDLDSVKSFSYRVGDDVTAALKSRLGG